VHAGLFLAPTDSDELEEVQSGTKISNNCLLLMFILTVDDEFLISEFLRAILQGGGHRVIATFDADEAIEVLERVLVITDINMPGSMDGLRLAAAIRHRRRSTPTRLLRCWKGFLSSPTSTCRARWTGSGWRPQSDTDGRRST
jgi:PleD family two-component response regulator